MSKSIFLFIICLFFSCNKEREIQNIFICKQGEYWDYVNDCQSHGVYFRFNQKGDYDKYNRDIIDGFELFNNDGDLLSEPRSWSIKNDSTFVWNNEDYKIETYTNDSIVLYYYEDETMNKKCKITFRKVIDK